MFHISAFLRLKPFGLVCVGKYEIFGNFVASVFMVTQEHTTISKSAPLHHLCVKMLLWHTGIKLIGVL